MDFQQMQTKARAVRALYAELETARYGRSWTAEEIMLGFLGDVGDLAKLVQEYDPARTSTKHSPTSSPTACGA